MRPIVLTTLVLPALGLVACRPLTTPRDVMGNFEVTYADNLRVYFGDDLVAEITAGEEATIDWNGSELTLSQVCGDEGVDCPSETWWRTVAVDQPWGSGYRLLNFVNLDLERGTPGQRMGGHLDDDGSIEMLSGLAAGAEATCAAIGVGTVTGAFNADATALGDGMVVYEWAGGCDFDGVQVGVGIRLESDFTATRTGDYDVASVTPEEPIDESGEVVDPEAPATEGITGG